MKAGLSLPTKSGNRFVLLYCTADEYQDVGFAIRKYVMQRQPFQIKDLPDGTVACKLPESRLERLLLCLPSIEASKAIHRSLTIVQSDLPIYPEIEIPDFRLSMSNYQYGLINAMIKHKNYICMDGVGLRKTGSTVAGITAQAAVPVLVVVGPSSAKWVWERIVQTATDWSIKVVDGTAAQRRKIIRDGADFLVINAAALRLHPELTDFVFDYLVTDEFHYFKNPQAQWTKQYLQLQGKKQVVLSATPFLNRPEETWAVLHRLWPDRFPSYWMFEKNLVLMGSKEIPVQKMVHTSKGIRMVNDVKTVRFQVGYQPDAMIQLRDFIDDPAHSIRRVRSQLQEQLPEELPPIIVLVDLTPEQRKLYNEIRDEYRMRLANGKIKRLQDMRNYYLRAAQACFSPELYGGSSHSIKVDQIKYDMAKIRANNEKAILFSQWKTATNILKRELAEYNPAYVDGDVLGKKRKIQEEKFNHDDSCFLYIGTIRANKESITLDAANYVLFSDEDFVPENSNQAIGRSPLGGMRGAGKSDMKIQVVSYLARGTVEENHRALRRHTKKQAFDLMVNKGLSSPTKKISIEEFGTML